MSVPQGSDVGRREVSGVVDERLQRCTRGEEGQAARCK